MAVPEPALRFVRAYETRLRRYGSAERRGQSLWNTLEALEPELAQAWAGTDLDSFHDETRQVALWDALALYWAAEEVARAEG